MGGERERMSVSDCQKAANPSGRADGNRKKRGSRRSPSARWPSSRGTIEMKHSIAYHGPLYVNRELLVQGATSYKRRDGTERAIPEPGHSVRGIRFGCMQGTPPDEFYAVRAMRAGRDVIFETPVLLKPDHTDGKGFAPSPTTFGDESAKRLLRDAIKINPSQTEELKRMAKELGWDDV